MNSVASEATEADESLKQKFELPKDENLVSPLRELETLQWKSTFVDELPGDPVSDGPVRQVRNACYSFVRPSLKTKDPVLVAWSNEVAELIGLNPSEMERPEFLQIFAGDLIPQGSKPYAQCYGGHQFGSWAGQLGDGRAITLGEVQSPEGSTWELQLKGAGPTPYSRHADGRAVLRSSVREFLASEALHFLGVPTTRALCLLTSGEEVLRDMFYNGNARLEPGAVVCRVAPSFLRFGSWQIHSSRGGLEAELGRELADYVVKHHFPHLQNLPEPRREPEAAGKGGEAEAEGEGGADSVDVTENKYAAWFAEVAERTGALVASWQAVGFAHGVLNTDNMSALGLTLDYGPFGFLEAYAPRYTPNSSDLPGRRYCFQAQPDVALWNVVQLANALVGGGLLSVREAQHCVSRYADTFLSEYRAKMSAKLGLREYHSERTKKLLQLMSEDSVDFTNLFRSLSGVPSAMEGSPEELLGPLEAVLGEQGEERRKAWLEWLQWYSAQLAGEGVPEEERRAQMNAVNPKFVLRNYLCQRAIEEAEKGDYSEVRRLHEVLKRPFEEQPGMEEYTLPAPESANKLGISMLSCSS